MPDHRVQINIAKRKAYTSNTSQSLQINPQHVQIYSNNMSPNDTATSVMSYYNFT